MLGLYINSYLIHHEAEGRSKRTIEWHENSLKLLQAWLKGAQLSDKPSDWDATLLRQYFVHLRTRPRRRGKPLTPHTVRNYASSVLAFCRWLHDEEVLPQDITKRVSIPQVPQLVKEPFSVEDVKKMLLVAKNEKRTGVRDHALLLFLLDSGCRASEVLSLRADDLIWNQRLAKVFGKGSKERVVFMSPETMRGMQRYMMRAPQTDCPYFFKTEEGKQLSLSGLQWILKRIQKRSGVMNVHPHRFRHSFALMMLRNGTNSLALQRIMGHTTLAMTNRYLAMVHEDLAKEHE